MFSILFFKSVLYYSSASFSGWFRLKDKSRSTVRYHRVLKTCCLILISRGSSPSIPPPLPLGCASVNICSQWHSSHFIFLTIAILSYLFSFLYLLSCAVLLSSVVLVPCVFKSASLYAVTAQSITWSVLGWIHIIRHDTTRHATTRHDTARHDTTRHDKIFFYGFHMLEFTLVRHQ
jgi:hypothetical protein